MISVDAIDGRTYRVTVRQARTTVHEVTVDPEVKERLAPGLPTEQLLRASFQFLLEREPNTAILKRFELPLIGRYFPEFESEIIRRA